VRTRLGRYSRAAVVVAAIAALPVGARAQDAEAAADEIERATSGAIVSEPIVERDVWIDVYDPWERMNRGIFWFNEQVDGYVLEPVAKGWDFVVPDPVENASSRFFDHIRFPIVFGNQILQLKPIDAASEAARFVVNTTVGFAGFFDAAVELGLEKHDEDFGQTLGYWGVPPGPYFVIPFIGASSVRDSAGLAADVFSQPYSWFVPFYASAAATGTDVINDRSRALVQIADERANNLDFYAFVRNAHWNNRRAKVRDQTEDAEPAASDEDLYYFEDEEEPVE
jgi:phospholipid-binding lipoprotein MlaA